MQRRRFLVAATGAGLGTLAGCSGSPDPGQPQSRASRRPALQRGASVGSGARAGDWSALARGLEGRLVRPDDDEYAVARRLFNTRFDRIRPAAVAFCTRPEDVQACIEFARRFDVTPTVRSGGHSYIGASTGTGLVVDVSSMAGVVPQPGRVVVGAGVRLVDLYARLATNGLAVPAGSCPTVGISGLALGGGVGVTSRAWGLTCDNLVAAEVVTPEGRVVLADEQHESDLFWALRGAGAGGFGVVTSLTLRTHPADDVALFSVRWPWRHAAAVVNAWQASAPHAPDGLWSSCHLSAPSATGGPSVRVSGLMLDGADALRRQLDVLTAAVRAEPSTSSIRRAAFGQAMMIMAGCARETVAACHLPWQHDGGRLQREAFLAASDIVTRPLPAAGITALLAGVERRLTGAVLLDALGGAVNRVPAGKTAFVHRNGLFLVQYYSSWSAADPYRPLNTHRARIGRFRQTMRRYVSGQAYQNYADADLASWREAYYGAAYSRLQKIKAHYDGDRLFRPPQGVTAG